jgi:WD40 repeat protein
MSEIDLKIKAVIGFSGKVPGGLQYSADGKYIVFPLGTFVCVKNVKTGKEAFLDGHTSDVSCIAMSHDGSQLASGQSNLPGVKVRLIVFEFII